MKLLIERIDRSEKQTIGRMFVLNEHDGSVADFPSLELPWKDNQKRISCIPTGTYPVKKHSSPKFGKAFWVQDVPGRSEILIHKGNFFDDILGCILPGLSMSDINNDGHIDVTSSSKAIEKMWKLLPKRFDLTIVNGHGM